jgi:hypothetical protein
MPVPLCISAIRDEGRARQNGSETPLGSLGTIDGVLIRDGIGRGEGWVRLAAIRSARG